MRLKKIILVSALVMVGLPLVFIALAAGTIAYDGWRMSKGEYPLADSSEAKIGRFVLRLDRYKVHPFLGEYKRVLTITDADGMSRSHDLFTDTGGGGLITVCETDNGDLRLVDRFETNIVETDGNVWASTDKERDTAKAEVVSKAGPMSQPGCNRMLGRFGTDDARNYGFRAVDGV